MTISIVPYTDHHASSFYNLNIEWLNTYFYVEPIDELVLRSPKSYIIDKGGYIFVAKYKDQVLGVVALMSTSTNGRKELTKMAVEPEARGKNIGQQLLKHCIDFGKRQNWDELLLYSNTKLENAIHIYKKNGFKEIKVEPDSPYKRSNIKMILKL